MIDKPTEAKPQQQARVRCRYERQRQLPIRLRQSRRRQLLALLWFTCSGFTWPGRVPHLSYQAAHGPATERVEALRLLQQYPSEEVTDVFLAALEDEHTQVRVQAARSIGSIDNLGADRAAASLRDMASAREPEEREAAVRALGALRDARALAILEQALHDPSVAVRAAACAALTPFARTDRLEWSELDPLLAAPEPELRLAATSLLASADAQPDPSRADAQPNPSDDEQEARDSRLLRAARDDSPEVRAAAVRVLGKQRGPQALAALAAGLADPNEAVRLWATAALGDRNDQAAVKMLRERAAGADLRAAQTALAALGRIDDASALAAIAEQLPRPPLTPFAVSSLVARTRRLRHAVGIATLQASADAVARALQNATDNTDAAVTALARGVSELAAFTDVGAGLEALLQAVARGRGDPYRVAQELAQELSVGHTAPLIAALVARLEHAPPPDVPRVLQAIAFALERAPAPDNIIATHAAVLGRYLDPEPKAPSPQLSALRARVAPYLESAAVGGEPRAGSPTEALVQQLDSPDARVRRLASDALARSAGPSTLETLVSRLENHALHPELSLLASAGVLHRYAGGQSLPAPLRERVWQQLQAIVTGPGLMQADQSTTMAALTALRASKDPRAPRAVAGLLRSRSRALRAAAVQALGDFDLSEARQLLRNILRGDDLQGAASAALALAELGSDRDVAALQRAAERGTWPLPGSAAYAAARIAQRGATRKHSLERVLCKFAEQRDTYVLANVVSALAALGADPCDATLDPGRLVDADLPSAVRVAGALWLRSIRTTNAQEAKARADLLARCAGDRDAAVAAACVPERSSGLPVMSGKTLVRALSSDDTPLRRRMLALRFPDGSVYLGHSDSRGQVLLPRVTRGPILLSDPADYGPVALPLPAPPEAQTPERR